MSAAATYFFCFCFCLFGSCRVSCSFGLGPGCFRRNQGEKAWRNVRFFVFCLLFGCMTCKTDRQTNKNKAGSVFVCLFVREDGQKKNSKLAASANQHKPAQTSTNEKVQEVANEERTDSNKKPDNTMQTTAARKCGEFCVSRVAAVFFFSFVFFLRNDVWIAPITFLFGTAHTNNTFRMLIDLVVIALG